MTNMSSRKSVHAILYAKPGKLNEVKTAVAAVKEETNSEKGTLTYNTYVDVKENTVVIFEEYEDMAAIEAHKKGKAFNSLMARGGELFAKNAHIGIIEEF